MSKFKHYNDSTGEYIETVLDHLDLPDNLDNPVVDGVERTMNLSITRATGWHYTDGDMLFIPAYRKVHGQALSFRLSYLNDEGNVLKEGIVFDFGDSRSFRSRIPLLDILTVVFDISNADQVESLVGVKHPLLSSKYLTKKSKDNLMRSIRSTNLKGDVDVSSKLKTILTQQTMIDYPERMYDILSLNNFTGLRTATEIEIEGITYPRFSIVSPYMAFQIMHSGMESVKFLNRENKIIHITIPVDFYVKLNQMQGVNESNFEEFHALEIEKDNFVFEGKSYRKAGVPTFNTLQLYMYIINRMLMFPLAGVEMDMQDYRNQKIAKFEDRVDDFIRADLELVHNKINTSENLLEAVSNLRFDKSRALKLIKNADSAEAVITKNENPLARTSQGNVLVRNVAFLSRSAVQVTPQDLGVVDPVDSTESKNIGKVTPLTLTTERAEDGSLYVPLYKVVNGIITDEIENVNATEVPELFIAEAGVDLSNNVLARHRNQTRLFPPHLITHVRVSPFSSTSACRANAVFMENTDQKRTQMTANAVKQTRLILRPKRPIVETGIESISANGDTGIKLVYTVEDVFADAGVHPEDIAGHEFRLSLVGKLGMAQKFQLVSTTNSDLFAPFNIEYQKSSAGSAYYFEIVAPSGLQDIYRNGDIVYKQHNVMLNKSIVETSERLAYHTKGNENYFDKSVALGQDLFVMFGFKHSFTADDATTISDRVIRDMTLATPVVVTKVFQKDKIFDKEITEVFGFSNNRVKEGFASNGAPLVGTYLNPGSHWLYSYTTRDGVLVEDKNQRLENSEHGEVIAVHEDKFETRVTITKWVHLQVGDKLSGRHGNKTIVAKILPQEMMPYDPITGRHIDIILNPLGIPSRGNYSQSAELQMSAEVYNRGVDTKIVPPFSNELWTMLENYENNKDLTELQLINSETGLYYPHKHFTGYMHYLRSVHISEDKFHAIGDSREIDVAFLQPVGGTELHEKGQAISSMEKEILASYGADGILDEIHGSLSADREGYSQIGDFFEENFELTAIDFESKNFHAEHMQHVALALHLNLKQDGNLVQISYMSDEDMETFVPIDERQADYYLTDKRFLNSQMYIDLGFPFLTPVAIKKFKFANLVFVTSFSHSGAKTNGGLTKDIMEGLIDEKLFIEVRGGDPSMKKLPQIIVYPSDINAEVIEQRMLYPQEAKTGMQSITDLLYLYPLEWWVEAFDENDPQRFISEKTGEFNEDLFKTFKRAKALAAQGGFDKFITTRFPVLPNKYRQAKNEINDSSSLTAGYKDIIKLAQDARRNPVALTRLYHRAADLMLPSKHGRTALSLFEFMTKKDKGGRIRGKIMKTRILSSMRAIIVPMFSGDPQKYGYPDFAGHPDSIGLPLRGALTIAQPRLLGYMKANHPDLLDTKVSEIDNVSRVIDIITLPPTSVAQITGWELHTVIPRVKVLKKELTDFINGSYVFYGRAPSLQETSMRGGRVYVHDELVVHLHSLLTTDLNADHDGDQIYISMPFTEAAVNDIKDKLLPSNNVLRYNDAKPSLAITQDALLGLFFATQDPEGDTAPRLVSSVEEVNHYVDLGLIKPNSRIFIKLENGKLGATTAGRLLVNNIIFKHKYDGLDYFTGKEDEVMWTPTYNGVISSDGKKGHSISGLQTDVATKYGFTSRTATFVYKELQDLGYRISEIRNLTVGIKDLTPALEVESINKIVKKHVEVARTLEELGMLPDNYLTNVEREVNKEIKRIDIMSKVPADNAYRLLAESGAKGKFGSIERAFGIIGFVNSNTGDKLPTPILSNPIKGLSQFQVEDLSYTQRDNAISTVFETSKPGETLRSGAFELSGLIIQEDPKEFKDEHLVLYQKEIGSIYVGTTRKNAQLVTMSFKGDLKNKPANIIIPEDLVYEGRALTKKRIILLAKTLEMNYKLDDGRKLFFETFKVGTSLRKAKAEDNLAKYSVNGKALNTDTLRQLYNHPQVRFELDDDEGYLFVNARVHPFVYSYLKNKVWKDGGKITEDRLQKLLEDMPSHVPLATHVNEFSTAYGITRRHAGFRAGSSVPYKIGENIGIKSSTATGQPANQLVISKRNMERTSGLDNGIDMFKTAIQSGKFFSNDDTQYEMLAPVSGFVTREISKGHTTVNLQGDNGIIYKHVIPAEKEHLFDFKFNDGDYVQLAQVIITPKREDDGECIVSPVMSFTWTYSIVNGVTYKSKLFNPSKDLVQYIRIFYMLYLESIYRPNNIILDPNHYGAFALQASRHVEPLILDSEKQSKFKTGHINLFDYFNDFNIDDNSNLVNMKLTNGSDTILLTAGPVAALAYRDAIATASRAMVEGPKLELSSLGKIALGVNIKTPLEEKTVLVPQQQLVRRASVVLEESTEIPVFDIEEDAFNLGGDGDGEDDFLGGLFDDASSLGESDLFGTSNEIKSDEEKPKAELSQELVIDFSFDDFSIDGDDEQESHDDEDEQEESTPISRNESESVMMNKSNLFGG